MVIIFTLIAAYFVGSIPTGYWFARYFFGIDITQHGSGNIGATNVARVLGSVKYFFLIFAFDAGKALVFLSFAQYYAACCMSEISQSLFLCSVAACLLLGNSFSIFLGGRGGKSVATLGGCIIFLYPIYLTSIVFASWGIVFLCTRSAFGASIFSALLAAFLYWLFFYQVNGLLLGIFLTLAMFWLIGRHAKNIKQFFTKG